jgi:hypothetical protein
MSAFFDGEVTMDRVRPVLDYVAKLNPVEHHDMVLTAVALQTALDRRLLEEIAAKVLDTFDWWTERDTEGPVGDVQVLAALKITQALLEAPDVGTAVLQVLIAQARRRGGSAPSRVIIPESLCPPPGTKERLLRGFSDAAAMYQDVVQAGAEGIARRDLGRDLTESRRNAAWRRLRACPEVSKSRAPFAGHYPPYLIWLHATGDLPSGV